MSTDIFQASGMYERYGLLSLFIILFGLWFIDNIKLRHLMNFKKKLGIESAIKNKQDDHCINTACHVRNSLAINTFLDLIIDNLNADKCFIFQYHNGNKDVAGIPFNKMTITYERHKIGITNNSLSLKNMQNIPLGLFCHWNVGLCEKGYWRIEDLSSHNQNDSGFDYFINDTHQKTQSIYAYALRDVNGILFGCVVLEFIKKKIALRDEDFDFFKDQCNAIRGVFLCTTKNTTGTVLSRDKIESSD